MSSSPQGRAEKCILKSKTFPLSHHKTVVTLGVKTQLNSVSYLQRTGKFTEYNIYVAAKPNQSPYRPSLA